ncbi:MAG: ABC-type uncharacterized transport system auxiliary subunit [Planctomycetota bacterium]|jgi:ABC-type uncharacterized transport system auxiliary subunit
MKITMSIRILTCLALALAPACLSLTPEPAPPTRWLSPMPAPSNPGMNGTGTKTPQPKVLSLRLGAVTASDAITDQLIQRISEVELTYLPNARWVEPPAALVQRMLEDELFQRRGFLLDAGAERRLDIQLIQFEEHLKPRREGRVALIAKLVDGDGKALMHRRFRASLPTGGEDPALIAQALTEGLRTVVQEIGELLSLK